MRQNNVINLFGKRLPNEEKANEQPKAGLPVTTEQISLPFNAPHSLMLLSATDFSNPADFVRFSSCIEVQNIIDMRMTPRLDFIGANRAQAFNLFEKLRIHYMDLLAQVNLKSYEIDEHEQQRLLSAVQHTLDRVTKSHHPIVMLFDNLEFQHNCQRELGLTYDVHVADKHYISALCEEPLRM